MHPNGHFVSTDEEIDDFILFAKTTQQGVQVVTVVIEKFSITSGQKGNDQPSSSTRENNVKLWKAIWNLSMPSRISMWAWQTIRGRIPTKDQLVRRG